MKENSFNDTVESLFKGMDNFITTKTVSAVLVIKDGNSKLVNVKNQDGITKLLDMVPEFVEKFKKKDDAEGDKEEK